MDSWLKGKEEKTNLLQKVNWEQVNRTICWGPSVVLSLPNVCSQQLGKSDHLRFISDTTGTFSWKPISNSHAPVPVAWNWLLSLRAQGALVVLHYFILHKDIVLLTPGTTSRQKKGKKQETHIENCLKHYKRWHQKTQMEEGAEMILLCPLAHL